MWCHSEHNVSYLNYLGGEILLSDISVRDICHLCCNSIKQADVLKRSENCIFICPCYAFLFYGSQNMTRPSDKPLRNLYIEEIMHNTKIIVKEWLSMVTVAKVGPAWSWEFDHIDCPPSQAFKKLLFGCLCKLDSQILVVFWA